MAGKPPEVIVIFGLEAESYSIGDDRLSGRVLSVSSGIHSGKNLILDEKIEYTPAGEESAISYSIVSEEEE